MPFGYPKGPLEAQNLDLVGSGPFDLDVIMDSVLDDSGGLDPIGGGDSWILTLASEVMAALDLDDHCCLDIPG